MELRGGSTVGGNLVLGKAGLAGYIPKFSTDYTLINSSIFEDASGNLSFSGSVTISGNITPTTVTIKADTSDTFNHRIAVYDQSGTSYGIMLWNTSGSTGEWSTMIYGPNQPSRRISFGKLNSNTPTNHSHVTEGAYFDLDDWSFNMTGRLFANGVTVNGNGNANLRLVGTDHVYVELYPKGATAGRKGYMGFAAANSIDLTIANEDTGRVDIVASNAAIKIGGAEGGIEFTKHLDIVQQAAAPAHKAGRMYFNGTKLFLSDGVKWGNVGGLDGTEVDANGFVNVGPLRQTIIPKPGGDGPASLTALDQHYAWIMGAGGYLYFYLNNIARLQAARPTRWVIGVVAGNGAPYDNGTVSIDYNNATTSYAAATFTPVIPATSLGRVIVMTARVTDFQPRAAQNNGADFRIIKPTPATAANGTFGVVFVALYDEMTEHYYVFEAYPGAAGPYWNRINGYTAKPTVLAVGTDRYATY